jgi:D-arabinose 1-dehydrogenase-like Zn-dependent alcohol dehydrogenase
VLLPPLLCAGVTTYNALRHTDARAGDLVAVLGGGHLGVQDVARVGFRTVPPPAAPIKEALARDLGAQHHVDSTRSDPAEEPTKPGRATAVLST